MPVSHSATETEIAEMDKDAIRKYALARRDDIDSETRRIKEAGIVSRVYALPEFIGARTVLLYASFRSEADTSLLMARCRQLGKRTVFPKVDCMAQSLVLYEVDIAEQLHKGFCGIPEPIGSGTAHVDIQEVDLAIVPGVAFDRKCRRVGYGQGFYDSLLMQARPFSVGMCFEEQMVECIQYESHDIPMDVVVTDERIVRRHGYG